MSTTRASAPAPMRPVGAPPARLGRGRRVVGRSLGALGVVLVLAALGFLTVGEGLAAFVPSDPATAEVGFTPTDDGSVRIVLDERAARETTELDLYAGDPYSEEGSAPVWVAERTDRAPTSWADDLLVGEDPPGFVVTKPLSVPLPDVDAVEVTNGCFGAPSDIPAGRQLHPGKVTFYAGDDMGLSVGDVQQARGEGFTPCDDFQKAGVNGVVGLGLFVGGVLLVPVGIVVLRAGRRASSLPPAGWLWDPAGRTRLRWWDGNQWSTVTRAP